MRKQMIQEELNQNNFFQFKGKTDIVQLKKENDNIILEKIKTGKLSIFYYSIFLIIAALIIYFARTVKYSHLVIIAAGIFAVSALIVLFLNYKITFNLNTKTITVDKSVFFYKKVRDIPFHKVLDFMIISGEVGHHVKIKTGQSMGYVNRIKEQVTICRLAKYEEAVELINWFRANVISPK